MDNRYAHPQVSALWSPEWTYDAWWRIECAVMRAQIEHGLIDKNVRELLATADKLVFDDRLIGYIRDEEAETKHDVVAFVNLMRETYGDQYGRWIHYGLTSSDLVDTAQGMRFAALYDTVNSALDSLWSQIMVWETDSTPVLGRTHGQPAEPTTMGIRARHWLDLYGPAMAHLKQATRAVRVAKIAGPVGTYAHNPPEVEIDVARSLGLAPQHGGASQIVPRGSLAMWANAAAQLVHVCGKVAMDLRLMNLLGEAGEPHVGRQVGSSSMAHKNNPIRAEQITGMQRIAAGYASMLQPLDLWLERDISNSAVERIAAPDLWHTTLHVVKQTTELLRSTKVDDAEAERNLHLAGGAPYVAQATYNAIAAGHDAESARAEALRYPMPSQLNRDPWGWFVRNYPQVGR